MKKEKNKEKIDKREVAIRVDNLSKTFRVPHEKQKSLKSAALNVFKKKTYEEFQALDDVSFEIRKGEFFGIIGRNGSGKSTLLKMLAKIYVPDSGQINTKGKISPFLELGVGFNMDLTGRENVFLGGAILGLSRQEVADKFDKIVDFAELRDFIDMKIDNYSSGMQVRLAFALAINAHAEILLMDEVLAVGDSNFKAKCMEEFNGYRDKGKTVVLVSHDIGVVQRYCDRAMLLRNGKIEKIGKADEIGDEYMLQNMSDEEKRLHEERIKIGDAKSETAQKIAEITEVKLLGRNGKEKKVLETGESLDMKISFKINEKIKGFNVGVGMYSNIDERIFSYNTQMDDFEIDRDRGFIVLHFDKLPILKGKYYLNVACFGDTEQTYYDIKQKYKELTFFSRGLKNRYKGLCDIEHRWGN